MEQHSRPSGYVIPQLLQRKRPRALEGEMNSQQQQQQQQQPHITTTSKNRLSKSEAAVLSNRVFECSELESLSLQITTAMIDIQKQIHRGEETYYEDTYAHGSLFRGWDAFVDAKDVGMSGSSSGSTQPTSRRVPSDLRWFSSSCHVSRNSRPASLAIRQYSSSIGGGINNNRPAPPVAGRQQAQVMADGANNSSTSFPPRLETTNTPLPAAEGSNSNMSNVRVAEANASAVGSNIQSGGGGDKKPAPNHRDEIQRQKPVQGTPAITTEGTPPAQPSQSTKDSSIEQPPLSGKKRKSAETTKVGGTKKQSRTEEPTTKKVP